jgi:hypothetical protein
VIVNKDLELFKVMEEALKRYLKAASLISQEGFDLLSKQNGLLWSEISDQIGILEELIKEYRIEEPTPQISESAFEENEVALFNKEDKLVNKEDIPVNMKNVPVSKENGPANLYNKVIRFLKSQKCDELQWVRTYSMKYDYEDFADFQIKYFEHREPAHQEKNYIFFGDTKRHYTIRKSGDDIIGDTSECFDIILNLSEVFDIDGAKKIS